MPAWADDFNAAGYDIADVVVYQLLATRLNLLYQLANWAEGPVVATPTAGNFLSDLIAELQGQVEALMSDFYYEPVPTSDRLMNFVRLLGSGRTGWRRKRPWELNSGGGLIIPAGAPSTSPSAGDKAISVDGLVRQYSGTAWESSGNPSGDVPNTWELEGQIEPGDYIGGWLLNELRDALQALTGAWTILQDGAGLVAHTTGGTRYYGTANSFVSRSDAESQAIADAETTTQTGNGGLSALKGISSSDDSGPIWAVSFNFEMFSYAVGYLNTDEIGVPEPSPVACEAKFVFYATSFTADGFDDFDVGLVRHQWTVLHTTSVSAGQTITMPEPSYTFRWNVPGREFDAGEQPTVMARLTI